MAAKMESSLKLLEASFQKQCMAYERRIHELEESMIHLKVSTKSLEQRQPSGNTLEQKETMVRAALLGFSQTFRSKFDDLSAERFP
eukprot:7029149-Pyramimonas_sp.AAC.1